MNRPETFELELKRFIRAPREKVFDAFVTEAGMRAWMGPRGMSVPEVNVDARAGGRYRVTMRARDGTRYVVGGSYQEISRPQKLVYTWQWEDAHTSPAETLITVTFAEKDGGTELIMRHTGFPQAAMRDSHNHGWNSSLNKLIDTVDARGSAATLTLLGDARSTYVRTARMALAEKGVKYTHQSANPHSPEVLAIHPFGRIPALRDGEFSIAETSAITRYIDESFDGPPLLPWNSLLRARCEQWVSSVNSYFYDAMVRRCVLQYLFPKGADGKPDRAVIDQALKEIPAQLAALDKAYAGGDFLAGEAPSLADLFVTPILVYLEQVPEGKGLFAAVPNVRRAQAVVRSRPSFKETQP